MKRTAPSSHYVHEYLSTRKPPTKTNTDDALGRQGIVAYLSAVGNEVPIPTRPFVAVQHRDTEFMNLRIPVNVSTRVCS